MKICTVQAQSVAKVLAMAVNLGLNQEELLETVGIDRTVLDEPDARIPNARLIELYEEVACRSGDPDFGLHMSEAADLGMFDVFGYTVLNSPNLGEAFRRTMRFYQLWTNGGRLQLETTTREVRFRYAVDPSQPPGRHECEFTLAFPVVYANRLTGRNCSPRLVRFQHAKPRQTTEHTRIFKAPVRFNQSWNELVFAPEVLNYPLPAADPHLGSLLVRLAEEQLTKLAPPTTLVEQVEQLIAQALRGGDPSLPVVARQLGLSPRTLQRKLREANTSHQSILDDLRSTFARQYLRNPEFAVCEVAYLLGFSDASVFNRAFRRWTGLSPQEFRRQEP